MVLNSSSCCDIIPLLLQHQVASALALESHTEYRHWLMAYVRYLTQEGMSSLIFGLLFLISNLADLHLQYRSPQVLSRLHSKLAVLSIIAQVLWLRKNALINQNCIFLFWQQAAVVASGSLYCYSLGMEGTLKDLCSSLMKGLHNRSATRKDLFALVCTCSAVTGEQSSSRSGELIFCPFP